MKPEHQKLFLLNVMGLTEEEGRRERKEKVAERVNSA